MIDLVPEIACKIKRLWPFQIIVQLVGMRLLLLTDSIERMAHRKSRFSQTYQSCRAKISTSS
jgi:hypothetical protein